ncbi:hypothetical protein F5148DRAFT_979547 [Russula earlei]|uniref:Uncharacterized protein n=1 Tax=Russula earlei TaxID=71964 RepID=A0ACC0UAU7_9AGAM|nr:hypothetical protein F5148DRAFT_979547 [Russula earlei]
MVKTGLPFMLEDKSGSLSGSDFVDLYDRMFLRVRCTRGPDGASRYRVYDMFAWHDIPVATLEYGAAGTLGNITIIGPGALSRTQPMAAFLVEVGGARHRKFIASDGQEYSWSWRTNTHEDLEWSCTNANGHTVAWYVLKIPGEQYEDSSGCMFGVEEPYPHLATGQLMSEMVDFLATLLIMRHIATREGL